MERDFGHDVLGMGTNCSGYPGAFTPAVSHLINKVLADAREQQADLRVLHLFSGISQIGEVRVDLERIEATHRQDVFEFISQDKVQWDFVLLDPPYTIQSGHKKLEEYAKTSAVASDVPLRNKLAEWFRGHAQNVIWLDMCAPLPAGFRRKHVWFLFPGGYHTVRVLSWLTRAEVGHGTDQN